MASTVLFEMNATSIRGAVHLVIDYDDVTRDVGGTVTGSGNPILQRFQTNSGKGSGNPIALAQFFGLGRQILFKNILSTDVLPLDPDGVPTKVDLAVAWS